MIRDEHLHALGALVMLALPAYRLWGLPGAPIWFAVIAVAVALFWAGVEELQAKTKYGRWLPLSEWSAQKVKEAVWPAAASLAAAVIFAIAEHFA